MCGPDGAVEWSGRARARVRGGTNSQLRNAVLQYAVTDFEGGPAALVGFPPGRQFILLGQSVDPLGVKTWAGLELARVMPPLSNTSSSSPPLGWTPRARFVELFLVDDGGAFDPVKHCQGTRVFAEHIEPGANRVPLSPAAGSPRFCMARKTRRRHPCRRP